MFIRFENASGQEIVHVRPENIDVWGQQITQGARTSFIVYHSGEKSFSVPVMDSLEELEKKINAARTRPQPKKRK